MIDCKYTLNVDVKKNLHDAKGKIKVGIQSIANKIGTSNDLYSVHLHQFLLSKSAMMHQMQAVKKMHYDDKTRFI